MHDIEVFLAMAKLNVPDMNHAVLSKYAINELINFDVITGIDTAGVEPLVTVLNIQNVLREDIPSQIVSRDELMASAPAEYDGYFQVPKTLE